MRPVIIESAKNPAMTLKLCVNDKLLNAGTKSAVIANAIKKAMRLIMSDSPRNCDIRDFFSAPNTFLIPTSAERLDERAVERFMKLIHAINNVNNAIEESIYK